MQSRRWKWLKRLFVASLALVAFLSLLQIVLNTEKFQRWALKTAGAYLKLDFNWDDLKFNGATGTFRGSHLVVTTRDGDARLTISKFSIGVDPISLLFKKVRLVDFQADDVTAEITSLPEPGVKKKRKKGTPFYERLTIENGRINRLTAILPGDKIFALERLVISSRVPLPFYSGGLKATVGGIVYRSPRFDFFGRLLTADGSYNPTFSLTAGSQEPSFSGKVRATDLLFGFNKTPNPWNPAAAWDPSLAPLLTERYPKGIPDNRAFLHVASLDLPLQIRPGLAKTAGGRVNTLGGEITLDGSLASRGRSRFSIGTKTELKMALLPLGKAKLRGAFDHFTIKASGSGSLFPLDQSKFDSSLTASFFGNSVTPGLEPLQISASPTLLKGVVNLPDLKITLGEGVINGKGAIDVKSRDLDLKVSGKGFDAQTAIRLFSSIDIPGKADLDGTITGKLANPLFNLSLQSPDAGYEGLRFGSFDGKLRIENRNLSVNGRTNLGGGGTGTFDLAITEVFRSSIQKVSLKTSFSNLPAGPLLKTGVITGSVSGFFNMTKEKQDYEGKGEINASQIVWYHVPIARAQAKLTLTDNKLTLHPVTFNWNERLPSSSPGRPFEFVFSPEGYTFSGLLLPQIEVRGKVAKTSPDFIEAKLTASNANLPFLISAIPVESDHLSVSGEFDLLYSIRSPLDSRMKATLSHLELSGEEKKMTLGGRAQATLADRILTLNKVPLTLGQGRLTLDGPLGFTSGSRLTIRGALDLAQFQGLTTFLAEGGGLAQCDLRMEGSPQDPTFHGHIDFSDSSLLFRDLVGELTEVTGRINLAGERLSFSSLSASYDDAPIKLAGWMDWVAGQGFVASDLRLSGKEIPLSRPDNWHLTADADVVLRGASGALHLTGTVRVIEGLYYKDYSLTQFVLKPVGVLREVGRETLPFLKKLVLDLQVKSAGEFDIKNNLAEIQLTGDLRLTGSAEKPAISGTVNVEGGEIHAMGIDFEEATGFITFAKTGTGTPYVEFSASHEIQDYEIHAKIRGHADNLSLVLESLPALSQKDIVSLIAYGRTPDQLSPADQTLFSTTAIASQVVGLLQRPLSRATHLDIVKLETDYTRQQEEAASRFSIGKKLSDRFSLAFTTDISLDESYKGFVLEYLLLDNLLLKGSKDTGSRYRFDLTWRLQIF